MKRIIFVSFFIPLFFITKINAQECGSPVAGPILQQVTKVIDNTDGLFWSNDRLLYVNRYDPHICNLLANGTNYCTNLEGLNEISSVYTIKGIQNQLVILADAKVILVKSDVRQNGEPIQVNEMEILTTINSSVVLDLEQSVTDNKGRIIIGASHDYGFGFGLLSSIVYIVDTNYDSNQLIPVNEIDRLGGIVLSSDYKNLFIGDSKKDVIYKYKYNGRDGTVGKREVVFNMTEHANLQGNISTLGITKQNQLWISMGGSGMVILYDYNKEELLQHIKVPASYPTSISYGGAKLDVLFIGTDKFEAEPGSGAIYAISGTNTQGFQQTMVATPQQSKSEKSVEFKNGYYMSKADLENITSDA